MGYTLRAALDCLPPAARITVVELNPVVVTWCAGPLATLTNGATSDKRVTMVVADVARVIADARPGTYDAIVLDLYEGPFQSDRPRARSAVRDRRAQAHGGGVDAQRCARRVVRGAQ